MIIKFGMTLDLLNALKHLNIAFEELYIVDFLLVITQWVVLLYRWTCHHGLIVGSAHRQMLAALNIDKLIQKSEITFFLLLVLVLILEAPGSLQRLVFVPHFCLVISRSTRNSQFIDNLAMTLIWQVWFDCLVYRALLQLKWTVSHYEWGPLNFIFNKKKL